LRRECVWGAHGVGGAYNPVVVHAMNVPLTLGVVGHVDHGKTTLVRALSGIETDRLEEERERGLSIVLGFAFLSTPHGVVDLIDVPGHEDFIRAMIAGATSLDGIMLCIAANEGVMPQTIEHLRIAQLLGVERGLVVLTKADLVDRAALAAVEREIARHTRSTFLAAAPVLPVSVGAGDGIEAVREAVGRLAAQPVDRPTDGPFFLPLDRAFTMRGFGLVVTGTLRGGELRVGDAVELQPGGKASTVRALQNHGRPIERASPGQRVAVNLRHLSRDEVGRGDVLAAPGSIVPTRRVDVELRLLDDADRVVKNGAVVRFLTGTAEGMGRIRLLDRREIAPGEIALAQIHLDRDIATRVAEPFLVRSVSPMGTVGGGRMLDVDTKRHRRFDAAVNARLETAASGDAERIVSHRLEEAGGVGVRLSAVADELRMRSGAGTEVLARIVDRVGAIRITDDLVTSSAAFDALVTQVITALERFHADQPLKKGLDVGSLAGRLPSAASLEVVQCVLRRLVEQEQIRSEDDLFRIVDHDPFSSLGERERKVVSDIEGAFLEAGLEPPPADEVLRSERVRQVIYRLLLETGRLVRLRTYDRSAEIVLHANVLDQVKQAIARKFPYPSEFAVKDVRDLLHSTRRHVVPVMEHFDATGITVRSGDLRRIREPWTSSQGETVRKA
jgi:selenocysteine-specific elongation factor